MQITFTPQALGQWLDLFRDDPSLPRTVMAALRSIAARGPVAGAIPATIEHESIGVERRADDWYLARLAGDAPLEIVVRRRAESVLEVQALGWCAGTFGVALAAVQPRTVDAVANGRVWPLHRGLATAAAALASRTAPMPAPNPDTGIAIVPWSPPGGGRIEIAYGQIGRWRFVVDAVALPPGSRSGVNPILAREAWGGARTLLAPVLGATCAEYDRGERDAAA